MISATAEKVGSSSVLRALPTHGLKQIDPFLLIDHMVPVRIAPGASLRIPPHPHAGFEVVTYLLDGEFFHRDSKGNDQVASAGDLNWMTSGSGIIHSEGPTGKFLQSGGRLELMQVWINLPAAKKSVSPSFRHYPVSSLPVVDNGDAWVKILIGNYGGLSSPVLTHTPLFYLHIRQKAGKSLVLPVQPDYSSALYLMGGKIGVGDQEMQPGQLADFNKDSDQVEWKAIQDSELIFFGGLPIGEKVVSYGPFVMNSFQDIQHAVEDYETGKMGQLEY